MAKKKNGKTIELGIAMPPGPYKEPSAAQVMKRESHYMAENVMRAHPKGKKMKNEIARAIAAQDRATLSRPPGVGPKLAARLATELKDKAAAFGVAPAAAGGRAGGEAPIVPAGTINEDAISALVNLGYKRVEAFGAVARVSQRLGAEAKLDAVIRAGLQDLAR